MSHLVWTWPRECSGRQPVVSILFHLSGHPPLSSIFCLLSKPAVLTFSQFILGSSTFNSIALPLCFQACPLQLFGTTFYTKSIVSIISLLYYCLHYFNLSSPHFLLALAVCGSIKRGSLCLYLNGATLPYYILFT
jgi:hypothetical protein